MGSGNEREIFYVMLDKSTYENKAFYIITRWSAKTTLKGIVSDHWS